jgi:hypothetical protein
MPTGVKSPAHLKHLFRHRQPGRGRTDNSRGVFLRQVTAVMLLVMGQRENTAYGIR